MKSGSWKIVPALSALALGTMFAPYAHAGCGLYTPAPHPASWQPQLGSPRLVLATSGPAGRGTGAPALAVPGRSSSRGTSSAWVLAE